MDQTSPRFQVFVKPAGAECNLNCRYCYYLDKRTLYSEKGFKRMSDAILEKYIVQHIEASTENSIFFSWHGGEPALAGIDFYKKAVLIQEKHKPAGSEIFNGIQTNATLINEDWCKFLSENSFFTGISIDGPANLHDQLRISKSGEGSFTDVLRNYWLLKKYNVNTEILCVINSFNAEYPLEVYSFLKSLGSKFITFIPLVQRDKKSGSGVSDISVSPVQFGSFLSAIFDNWISGDIGRIKIQIIEEALRVAFNQEHTLCIFKKTCGKVPVVEVNGDFYSCDHFVDKDNFIGNINDNHLSVLLESEKQINFGKKKEESLPGYCLKCDVKEMCNGECPKNRFIISSDGEPGLNYLCEGYRTFFRHIHPFMEAVNAEWQKQKL